MEFPIEPLSKSPINQTQTIQNKQSQNHIKDPLNQDFSIIQQQFPKIQQPIQQDQNSSNLQRKEDQNKQQTTIPNSDNLISSKIDQNIPNQTQESPQIQNEVEQSGETDIFDIIQIKTAYPKVRINIVANMHQEKVIHVIQEDDTENAPKQPSEIAMQEGIKMAELQSQQQEDPNNVDVVGQQSKKDIQKKTQKEVLHQDNIFEIEMQVESDIEGGVDIQNDCIYGHLQFLQVPSYQVENSLNDKDMTIELMQEIQGINIRIYRLEISGLQINNDSELQSIVSSFASKAGGNLYKSKIRKQMVKEFEIVDGHPILDEYQHYNFDVDDMENNVLEPQSSVIRKYKIDFRLPLKGINSQLISPTQLNICNMFSTLYFMQLVTILKSKSIKVPQKKISKSANGYQVIESQPIMLKFIR